MSPRDTFRFLRFELLRVLGRGMAVVYLAYDPERKDEIALKLIPLATAGEEEVAAEQRGARLQQRLGEVAPQVAKVYEHGTAHDHFYVAMEYVEGFDLAQVLSESQGPLDLDRSLEIALQLCGMLEIAHGLSMEIDGGEITAIIHGDLKPENVRLQDGHRVRILDFGASKVLSSGRKITRNLFGTYPYTPPEQLRSSGLVNEQSDLWAVGIILYRMVAGYEPYRGPRPEDLERQILDGPPSPLPPDCPPPLKQIIQRCLSADPQRRYATAKDLAADLAAFRSGRELAPWPARDAAATHRVPRVGGPLDAHATRRLTGEGQPPSEQPAQTATAPVGVERPIDRLPIDLHPLHMAKSGLPHRLRRMATGWKSYAAAGLAVAVLSQVYVWSTGQEIVRQLAAEASPAIEEAWARYHFASHFTPFDLGLGRAKANLRLAALASAERVLSSYRANQPTTRQGDWQRACDHLEIALRLEPEDPPSRARLLYSQAHVDRIDAASLRAQEKLEAAHRKWDDAIFRFGRAAEMAPGWPDPFLGLARIHAYDRFDLEALAKALAEAERRGYSMGARETAQLADGHLTKGKQLYRSARVAGDGALEAEMLEQAVFHLERAADRYEDILGFGRAESNRQEALRLAGSLANRLRTLRGSRPGAS